MLALKTITFKTAPRIPGVRAGDLIEINCENPPESMRDWHAVVRGGVVLLVSPPGWLMGKYSREATGVGARRIHEIPRNNCFLFFEGDSEDIKAVLDLSKTFTSAVFGVPQAKDEKSENDR